ncbi:MAG TPA: ATP-binding protein [Ilumatobacteraceae bacterium]
MDADRLDRFVFGDDVADVGRARDYAEHVLRHTPHGAPARAEIVLVVSELVTNAIRHAGGHGALRLVVGLDGVRIQVDDHQPRLRPRSTDVNQNGGRGLALVAAISARWGVVTRHDGKTVWAECRRHSHPVGATWPSIRDD